jgi:hypothetical protein
MPFAAVPVTAATMEPEPAVSLPIRVRTMVQRAR